jgi:serine-type D-Ala-D-Ala endopeptidase (penicillin-binding protein 7)
MQRIVILLCAAICSHFAASAHAVSGAQPNLFSQKALVVDARTSEVLVSRQPSVPTPIASITKLMTAMVVLDASQSMEEWVEITADDVDTIKGSRSRLHTGMSATRRDLLTVALMSSENRAAHALCRTYPGGLGACLRAMNAKARELSMRATLFADPTGLSPQNVSTAEDLVRLLQAAEAYPLVKALSISHGHDVALRPTGRMMTFGNSNALVRNAKWDVQLQKTGYIAEAGTCVVMGMNLAGRKVWMVLLDAAGRYSKFGDAQRIKTWLETGEVLALPKLQVAKKRFAKRGVKNKKNRRK